MSKFRNQESLRTNASRIGGGTLILSIILIGMFSTRSDKGVRVIEDMPAPLEIRNQADYVLETDKLIESGAVYTENSTLEAKAAVKESSKNVAAPMQTSSMVQYGSMAATIEGNEGKIIWKTLRQRHIKAFEVQRSLDDETYESLGTIEAEGSGDHLQEKLYAFIDEKLASVQMPRVYYRVKQIGFDGLEDYSDVIEYEFGLDLGLYSRIEGNSGGSIQVLYAADKTGPITLRLFDVAGQIVDSRSLDADFDPQLLAIDASTLKGGNYFLKLEDGSNSVTEQFSYQN